MRNSIIIIGVTAIFAVQVGSNDPSSGIQVHKSESVGYHMILDRFKVGEEINWSVDPSNALKPLSVEQMAMGVEEAEDRLAELGFIIDCSVYLELPQEVSEDDLRYLLAAAKAVSRLPEVKPMVTRSVHRIDNRWDADNKSQGTSVQISSKYKSYITEWYPLAPAITTQVADEPVHVKILPDSAKVLSTWPEFIETDIDDANVLDMNNSCSIFIDNGFHYSFTLFFPSSKWILSDMPSLAMPEQGRHRGIQSSMQPYYPFYSDVWAMGWAVLQKKGLEECLSLNGDSLDDDLAEVGLMTSIRLTEKIWLVEFAQSNFPRKRTLVFPIVDASGGARIERNRPSDEPGHLGRFENQLKSEIGFDPRFGRHSLLRVPVPKPMSADDIRVTDECYPQERFVVDSEMAMYDIPVIVFRKAETWKPFMEDYVLDQRLSFHGVDADSATNIVVFASIEPEPLLRLLGALRDVDVDSIIADDKVMAQLNKRRR